MAHDQETSHTHPGFGRNTGGWGIFIVGATLVLFGLFSWWLWNSGSKEVDHYRLPQKKAEAHAGDHQHEDHGAKGTGEEKASLSLGHLDTKGNFIYQLGDAIELKLPNGTALKVGDKSTEARLIRFLIDQEQKVDTIDKTKGWITCDRIFFESSSAQLSAESDAQIANLAIILQAFPQAAIKLGGYTDNTGDSAVNKKLSDDRAAAVLAALRKEGATNDLASEGYGSMWPLETNDTELGKARNRRVDVRVTRK
jgi:outer membrane protein OmpA-like peptidoglycan-associated protein